MDFFQFKYYFHYIQIYIDAWAQPGGATMATAELPVDQLFYLNNKFNARKTEHGFETMISEVEDQPDIVLVASCPQNLYNQGMYKEGTPQDSDKV